MVGDGTAARRWSMVLLSLSYSSIRLDLIVIQCTDSTELLVVVTVI